MLRVNCEDKVIWCGSSDGKYSVKLRYFFLDVRMRNEEWLVDLFWGKECLPKAGTFAWLAFRGRILTGERRKRLGFHGPSRCVMCEKAEETVDHLLLHCVIEASCWECC